MASGPITSWQIDGEIVETVSDFIFLGSKITADGEYNHEIKRRLLLGRKVMTNLDIILKNRDITLPTKIRLFKTVFSSSHVWMWELDYKESWAPKNWSFWTVVLEKTLERPLDCKEIHPVHPKENQSWIFIRRTNAEAETPILWPPDVKSWLIGKEPDAGKDWRQEEKGMTGWGGWMASPTQWTWLWVSSRSCWWTGRPGVLQCTGSQSQTWLSDWTELKQRNWKSSQRQNFQWMEQNHSVLKCVKGRLCWNPKCSGTLKSNVCHTLSLPAHLVNLWLLNFYK